MSYEPTWSLIIACYLFLAGLGGSAFLTSALLRKFCPQAVNMIRIGRIIGPATVIVGLLLLIVDATAGFHNPLRF
ncbi:MAG: NrfD/PsrC family molybdoenzyme membrane anchor subunit, partial [Coriobacteriales bacterium]